MYFLMVRKERLELSRQRRWYLKPVRLPIPPLSQLIFDRQKALSITPKATLYINDTVCKRLFLHKIN